MDKHWSDARIGYEHRLTEAVIDATQSVKPSQLDFASWPTISGDHSCSAEKMLYTVLNTEWILKVADVAARLKIDLVESENQQEVMKLSLMQHHYQAVFIFIRLQLIHLLKQEK